MNYIKLIDDKGFAQICRLDEETGDYVRDEILCTTYVKTNEMEYEWGIGYHSHLKENDVRSRFEFHRITKQEYEMFLVKHWLRFVFLQIKNKKNRTKKH